MIGIEKISESPDIALNPINGFKDSVLFPLFLETVTPDELVNKSTA